MSGQRPLVDLPSDEQPEAVELEIDDVAYSGWRSGEVRLSIEEVAHSFSLNYVTEMRGGVQRPIHGQDECRVLIDGQGVIEGYVFQPREYEDEDRYELSVAGRSVTADLVDCSISGSYKNAKLETIARAICDPFDIKVDVRAVTAVANERFDNFGIKDGEKAYEALARAARRRGLIVTTENGILVFSTAGAYSTTTELVRGVNILSRDFSEDWSKRFSPITFKGQTRATRQTHGEACAIIGNQVEDRSVIRYRPQVMQQGDIEGTRDLGVAARHQCNRQGALSERLILTVPGWKTDEGKHWRPNTLVRVRDRAGERESKSLLVAEVGYPFDAESDKGRVTQLTFTRPEAFDMVDYPARRVGDGWV